MKIILRAIRSCLDVVLLPVVVFAALLLKGVRRLNVGRLPLIRKGLQLVGVMPVLHHYYEPIVYAEDLRYPLDKERYINGLDLNVDGQIEFLNKFHFNEELKKISLFEDECKSKTPPLFYYHNPMFGPGDSEFLYNVVRTFKPNKIVEVGSGYSTLMAGIAIKKNIEDNSEYTCEHICIEPYEQPWLELPGATILRKPVQECDMGIFDKLQENDLLFIDSSHVIRPQGDVLYEYQEILGRLNPGVLFHVHDIFTPRDYIER